MMQLTLILPLEPDAPPCVNSSGSLNARKLRLVGYNRLFHASDWRSE